MRNNSFQDREYDFWQIETTHLKKMMSKYVQPRLAHGDIGHLSIFACAPQPLLMLLGFLVSDIPAAEVYQLHREPQQDWKWQDHPDGFEYNVVEPSDIQGQPALVLSLSAHIAPDRIKTVIPNATIWSVEIDEPNNDFLKSRQQLQEFRQTMRQLMDRIKILHGDDAVLHVFPAVPVAVALEIGRIIMPKADLPLKIYDENKSLGGFVHALNLDANDRFKD